MIRLQRLFALVIPFLILSACSYPASEGGAVSTEPAVQEQIRTQTPLPSPFINEALPEQVQPQAVIPTSRPRSHSHSPTEPAPMEEQEVASSEFAHNHLEVGPHLRLASSPDPSPEDERRAEEIAREAYHALERFSDYRVALEEGYQILAPNLPQEEYHFINLQDAFQNIAEFDPARPTALLFKKAGEGYEWVGVMYSAPDGENEADLGERYPLSMGRWHAHVNVCLPPDRMNWEKIFSDPKFGLQGSIDTPGECADEGGTFLPDLFGWMLHVYFADFE